MDELTIEQARALAIASQGFGGRTGKTVTRARIRGLLRTTAPLQIDSVNVLERAHYLPVFSRLGPYDRRLLDRMAYEHRDLFEYWGHMASFVSIEDHPLMRYRMERTDDPNAFRGFARWATANQATVDAVHAQVRDRGPIAASELEGGRRRRGKWWDWPDGKMALEWLFYVGTVTAASRRNFERVYDLTERVLPRAILDLPRVPAREAQRQLLLRAARAVGVGTARDLADYFRVNVSTAKRLIAELASERALVRVRVEGWKDDAFMLPRTRIPPPVAASALVSPFDPLVWERARTERLFGFRYRIEIYVPAPKRVHGYYVLPFLHRGRLVARTDLKADRKARSLLVQSAFVEPDPPGDTADALAAELRTMAAWLGLDDVRVARRGNLANAVRAALRA